jgi:hypothetical protein
MKYEEIRESSASVVTSPQAEWPRNRSSISGNEKDFSLLRSVQSGSGINPASYLMDTEDISTGVKRSKRDANHSL